MIEKISALMEHEGIKTWILSAIAKWLIQLRKKDFKFVVFFTDFVLAMIMGYVSWELVQGNESIGYPYKLIFVFVISFNAVFVLSAITDKKVAKTILSKYFSIEEDLKRKI